MELLLEMEILSFSQGNGDGTGHSCSKLAILFLVKEKGYLEKAEVRKKVSPFSYFSTYISFSIEKGNFASKNCNSA